MANIVVLEIKSSLDGGELSGRHLSMKSRATLDYVVPGDTQWSLKSGAREKKNAQIHDLSRCSDIAFVHNVALFIAAVAPCYH